MDASESSSADMGTEKDNDLLYLQRRIEELKHGNSSLVQKLHLERQKNTRLLESAAIIQNALTQNVKCPICLNLMRTPLCLRTCGHTICFDCLRQYLFVRMNMRRQILPDSLPRGLEINSTVSVSVLRQLNKHRCRASYPCPICLSTIQDPPVSISALDGLVEAGLHQYSTLAVDVSEEETVCEGTGSWDGFFAPRI